MPTIDVVQTYHAISFQNQPNNNKRTRYLFFIIVTVILLGGLFLIIERNGELTLGWRSIHRDNDTIFSGKIGNIRKNIVQQRRLLVDECPVNSCQSTYPGCSCIQIEEKKETWVAILEWLAIVLLVAMSALFSGLTLGLMSLDLIELDVVIGGDPDSKEAHYAKKIKPVRSKGNLLLCTLLIGNVAVNSLLSILLADYTSGALGFVLSTIVIVIFGEIFPQATCSRHSLYIGSKAIPIVKVFILLFFVVAFPISWILDSIFKEEIGSVYSQGQLQKLVEIHKHHKKVDIDQAKMMDGALSYKNKTLADIMTKKEDIFMLQMHDTLSFETMAKIFQKGCSRIPVYEDNDKNKVVGVLLTKDLILIDPEDNTSVSAVVQFFGRQIQYLWFDTKLPEVLKIFLSTKSHMAVVRNVNNDFEDRDPFYEIQGLVTLEDVIEEIIQEEILDETDQPAEEISNITNTKNPNSNIDRSTFDFALLRLLDAKSQANQLSSDEISAIVAHMSTNLIFIKGALKRQDINTENIKSLVCNTPVLDLKFGEQLYKSGKPLTHCTLILSGSLEIISGSEGFRSRCGQWSFVGQSALDLEKPSGSSCDFTASVSSEEGLRCLRINRAELVKMLEEKNIDENQMERAASFSEKLAIEEKVVRILKQQNSFNSNSMGIEMTSTDNVPSKTNVVLEVDDKKKRASNNLASVEPFIKKSDNDGPQ